MSTLKPRPPLSPGMQPRDLSDHAVYQAGRGIEEVARDLGVPPDDLVKLSSNENPHGPSPAAVEAIRETAPDVDVYPTTAHADLTERLAADWDLTPEQVWLSPGSRVVGGSATTSHGTATPPLTASAVFTTPSRET